MKSKKILLIVIVFISTVLYSNKSFAQVDFQAQMVSYITIKLKLTTDEAQKFWPVFNEYYAKRREILKERAVIYKNFKDIKMTTAQIDESLNKVVQLSKAESQLLDDYTPRFCQVLPSNKVLRLYIVQEEFKYYLLKQLKDKGQQKTDGL